MDMPCAAYWFCYFCNCCSVDMSFAINSSLYIMTYSLTYCVHAIVHHSLNHVLAIVLAYAHNTLQSQAEIMPEANADGHVAENVRNADNTRHNLPSQTDRHLRNPWLQSAWTFQTIPESIHCASNDFTLQRAVVSVQMAGIIFEAHRQTLFWIHPGTKYVAIEILAIGLLQRVQKKLPRRPHFPVRLPDGRGQFSMSKLVSNL